MKNTSCKWVALIYTVALFLVYTCHGTLPLASDTPWWHHLTYHHFHASVFHLLCNLWAFLTIVFYMNPSITRVIGAFLLASTFPASWLGDSSVIGLSGTIYVLCGMYSLSSPTLRGRVRYNTFMLVFITAGLVFPSVCVSIHLYCYALGLVIAVLNYPFFKTTRQ